MIFQAKFVKTGGSISAVIPAKIVRHYRLNDRLNENMLLEIKEFENQFKKLAIESKLKGETVTIKFGDKEISGKVSEVDNENLTLFNETKDTSYFIPLSIITSLSA